MTMKGVGKRMSLEAVNSQQQLLVGSFGQRWIWTFCLSSQNRSVGNIITKAIYQTAINCKKFSMQKITFFEHLHLNYSIHEVPLQEVSVHLQVTQVSPSLIHRLCHRSQLHHNNRAFCQHSNLPTENSQARQFANMSH